MWSALNPAEASYVASRPELGDSKSAAFSPHNQLQLLGVRRIKASGFQLAGVESNCSELRRRKVSGYKLFGLGSNISRLHRITVSGFQQMALNPAARSCVAVKPAYPGEH